MGTRADFYSQTSGGLEWLGSIAWDGYPSGIPATIFDCKTDEEWREKVAKFIASRDDGTKPDQGWPWPWEDSSTTDCAYAQVGKVACIEQSGQWVSVEDFQDPEDNESDATLKSHGAVHFPNMKDKQNLTLGRRSGLIVLGLRG